MRFQLTDTTFVLCPAKVKILIKPAKMQPVFLSPIPELSGDLYSMSSRKIAITLLSLFLTGWVTAQTQQPVTAGVPAGQLTTAGVPARLLIREAGPHSIRITLKPLSYAED